ncbi:MAG: helix-turn-helix transcriptional regulator [Clostridia bacterium]|nr:helix-turn-helix transcriptional regulator [Clostridia bacterium]
MTIATAVSKRIDEFLYSRGITLYKLAKDSGLPIATLQNLYRGNTKSPTLAVIYKICGGLRIDVSEFLNSPFFSLTELELD